MDLDYDYGSDGLFSTGVEDTAYCLADGKFTDKVAEFLKSKDCFEIKEAEEDGWDKGVCFQYYREYDCEEVLDDIHYTDDDAEWQREDNHKTNRGEMEWYLNHEVFPTLKMWGFVNLRIDWV